MIFTLLVALATVLTACEGHGPWNCHSPGEH